jgi:hypothetical protein
LAQEVLQKLLVFGPGTTPENGREQVERLVGQGRTARRSFHQAGLDKGQNVVEQWLVPDSGGAKLVAGVEPFGKSVEGPLAPMGLDVRGGLEKVQVRVSHTLLGLSWPGNCAERGQVPLVREGAQQLDQTLHELVANRLEGGAGHA